MRSCDERHHVWPLFLKTYSLLVETLDAELETEGGLPLSWFDVLVLLADAPDGRVRMNELSESVLLSKSGVTRLVDRMEKAGLVTRGACAADRRVVYAVITHKGRAAFRRAAPVAFRGVEEHFARHLTPSEERALTSLLRRVLGDVERSGRSRQAG
jgi:DNA-binding MarR family transcriptional regulator